MRGFAQKFVSVMKDSYCIESLSNTKMASGSRATQVQGRSLDIIVVSHALPEQFEPLTDAKPSLRLGAHYLA